MTGSSRKHINIQPQNVAATPSPDYERSVDHQTAFHLLNQGLTQLGLTAQLQHQDNQRHTSWVALVDHQGRTCATGGGKGKHHFLEAIGEALEHLFTMREHEDWDHIHWMDSQECQQQAPLTSCPLISNYPTSRGVIPTVEMFNWPHNQSCFVPLILVNPQYQISSHDNSTHTLDDQAREFLLRYGSNSGSGLGVTLEDALIHALCEQLERHYLSHLLMTVVKYPTPYKFTRILLTNSNLEQRYAQFSLELIHCAAICNIPFYAIIATPKSGGVARISSGCSLSFDHALSRAMAEFYQVSISSQEADDESQYLKRLFESHPRLQAFVNCDTSHLPYQAFQTFYDADPHVPSSIILKELMQRLTPSYQLFYRIKTLPEHPFYVVSTYIPQMERFFNIMTGSLVVPLPALKVDHASN